MKAYSLIITKLNEYVHSGNYWRLVGLGLIVTSVGLLFGFAFWIIFEGVFFLLFGLTPFWHPANQLFGKLSLANSDNLIPLSGWKWIHFFLIITPWLLLIIAGIYILSRTGFYNQNLVYMLLRK